MRVFVYELVTGGGLISSPGIDLRPLLDEGRAMATALAGDLAASPGVEVVMLRDARLAGWAVIGCRMYDVASARQEHHLFHRLAAEADWTIVIAPETAGLLLERCGWVSGAGGRLLGPSAPATALCGDKQALAEHLAAAGVPVPEGMPWNSGPPWPVAFPYPAVWKPRDGAGSQGIVSVAAPAAIQAVPDERPAAIAGRLERFCPGQAASVAFLCGPTARLALPPASQHLSADGRFKYLGGWLPLEPELARRAARLARQAVATLPPLLGYLGVDLVLGDSPDGARDVVIEINPRLTTSYVGLRALARHNLAGAMLELACGHSPELSFQSVPIHFDTTGRVQRLRSQQRILKTETEN